MCGISGILYYNTESNTDAIHNMAEAIGHRGPDARVFFVDPFIHLAHNRLRIIDLSANADQPMHAKCGPWVMVYNGEIYNYKALAKKYLKNLTLHTQSDSEVLAELFSLYGESIVPELQGMYAAAFYNKISHELVLIRDRFGKKPLYYLKTDKFFAFSSEISGLSGLLPSQAPIHYPSIRYYFHLNFVPEPYTIYKDIYKMPSGFVYTLRGKTVHAKSFKEKIITDTCASNTAKDPIVEVESLLSQAVSVRLQSDAPWGCLLSGGTDSALVTAMAVRQHGAGFPVFHVSFQQNKIDETYYAKQIAQHLKVPLHIVPCTPKQIADTLIRMPHIFHEPYADTSAIPTLLIAAFASHSVKMLLTGDGGDEIFLGYGTHTWANRLQHMPHLVRQFLASILKHIPTSRYNRLGMLLNFLGSSDYRTHIFSQEHYFFSERELPLLLPGIADNTPLFEPFWRLSAQEQALWELNYYLKDDLLVKIDRCSMYYGVEMRSPLLDDRLFAYANGLPTALKMKGNTRKYILKKILENYIPKPWVERPKWGFSIPLGTMLRKELSDILEEYTSKRVCETHGIVHYTYVQDVKKRFLSGQYYLYNRLWLVICLHLWFAYRKGEL